MATGQANAEILRDKCPTLNCAAEQPIYCGEEIDMRICKMEEVQCLMDQGGGVMNVEYNKTGTLRRETHGHEPIIQHNTVVRRLTPIECERLQGFPDNFTNIPWRGKPSSPDGRRYKALGNSMAVPVMQWIGKRIEAAEPIERDERAIERALYVTPSDDGQLSLF